MHTEEITHQVDGVNCIGYMAYDENIKAETRPAVLVVHAFEGRNELACEYARKLAELGYVGFAVDIYGEKHIATDYDGCIAAMMPFINDRAMLRRRILSAFETVKNMDNVDANRIGAMGFCFGGLTVLDLARAGADVKGVVSLHGNFTPPQGVSKEKIRAKVLALHGYDDPSTTPAQFEPFAKEMNEANVDWQFVFYSHTKHAYTDPQAEEMGDPSIREYNALTTQRAWNATVQFFDEVL